MGSEARGASYKASREEKRFYLVSVHKLDYFVIPTKLVLDLIGERESSV